MNSDKAPVKWTWRGDWKKPTESADETECYGIMNLTYSLAAAQIIYYICFSGLDIIGFKYLELR